MKRALKKLWLSEAHATSLAPDHSFSQVHNHEVAMPRQNFQHDFAGASELSGEHHPSACVLGTDDLAGNAGNRLSVRADIFDDNGSDFWWHGIGVAGISGGGIGALNQADLTGTGADAGEHAVAKRVVAELIEAISSPLPQGPGVNAPEPVVISTASTLPDVIETTDAANDTSTIYELQLGQTAQGTLGSFGDRDWYAVDLVANQTYSFALTGTGVNNVIDPYLRLMDPSGVTELQFNDDGLPGLNSVFTFTPTSSGRYYISAGAFNDTGTGQYGVAVSAGARPSFDTRMGAGVIDADSAWTTTPGTGTSVTYAFRQSPATYTVTGHDISTFTQLTATEMAAVRLALQAWSEVSGITFVEVNPGGYSDNATMLFANYTDDDGAGAFAAYPGSRADAALEGDVWLNTNSIPTGSAIDFGSYAYHAIAHEIGHAIGLSHPGLYDAAPGVSITYGNDAQFTEDSHQYSIMSYFDESNTGAQFLGYPETPMLSDVYAAQQIYGTNLTTRVGDTIYGFNSNAGAVYDFSTNVNAAFAIWDAGGNDTLDASGYSTNQTINLNEGAFSSIGNSISNIVIALGAVIENAIGGSGGDTLTGNSANNRLQGNGGADNLLGNDGDDTLLGGAGADTIDGGAGTADIAAYDTSAVAVSLDLQSGVYSGGDAAGDVLTGIEGLQGSAFNDSLFGNGSDNRLFGLGGNDFIQGRGGADTITGGDGDDWLDGGAGGDSIDGGAGTADVAAYGASATAVNLDLQSGVYSGGDAAGDVLTGIEGLSGSGFNDSLFGNASANRLFGQGGNDFIQGRGGVDTLVGGNGDDWLDGGAGGDTIDGGAGTADVAAYGASATAVSLDLQSGVYSGGDAVGDVLTGIEGLSGSALNDSLFGNASANRLFGQNGNDFIQGRGGADLIQGGNGDDWLDGGAGADTIDGGAGTADVAAYGASATAVNLDLQSGVYSGGDAAGDVLSGIEGLSGSGFADTLSGNASANRLYGQGGADTLAGRGGDDLLIGGNADDIFVFTDDGAVDRVNDFDDFGDDLIQLSISGVSTFNDVAAVMTQVGADVFIDFATTDILLVNTTLASVAADDFMFV